jgi:DNA-binding NarL/FixJ family response regulator
MSEGRKHEVDSHDDLRVLLVDDHDLFRTGLRNLLEEQGVAVVGEAARRGGASGSSASSRPTWS